MEIQLPESEGLDIQDLKCIFDKKSECYKLFWFKAILKKVKDGQQDITYNELVCLMMADAYYMVNEYHLNLGPNDSLEKIVKIIAQQTEVKPSEKVEKIYDMLLDYSDKEITTLKSNLIKNVPYCLQSHFLQGTTIARLSSKQEEKIRELNRQQRLLYYYGTAYEHNKAFRVAETDSRIKKLLKKYLEKNLNDMTIKMDLYTNRIEEEQYEKGISKIIEPIYLSAQNAGYKEWINRIDV